jgi:UDP-N-acetylmuramoyl-tripeptide--D-alanyl-D-alanine ligase
LEHALVTSLTYQALAQLVSADPNASFLHSGPIGRISTDTRTLQAGDLYIALVGRSLDGHRFVAQALLEAHAAAALVARSAFAPGGLLEGQHELYAPRLIVVEDTLQAYHQLAWAHRQQLTIPVIAITGSNGKTTTKDLLAALLATHFDTVAKTAANENNEYGVPKTLLHLTPATQAAVVEMGMRGPEEIRPLARITQPTVGIITHIGEAHLERLGSRRAIADAKGELIDELGPDAVAVLPRDNAWFEHLRAKARCRVVSFGWHEDSDVRVLQAQPTGLSTTRVVLAASAVLGTSSPLHLELPMAGLQNATNLAAAAAAACLSGAPASGFEQLGEHHQSSGRRLEALTTPHGYTLYNDVYNASPASVEAALRTLAALPVEGRRAAVLGDMYELGPDEAELHRQVGELAATNVYLLVTVGPLSHHTHQGALALGHATCQYAADRAEAVAIIAGWARSGDAVLIKASRGMQLDEVVARLTEAPQEASTHA